MLKIALYPSISLGGFYKYDPNSLLKHMDLRVILYADTPKHRVCCKSGLALLCYGGNWLVDGGIAIAKRFLAR